MAIMALLRVDASDPAALQPTASYLALARRTRSLNQKLIGSVRQMAVNVKLQSVHLIGTLGAMASVSLRERKKTATRRQLMTVALRLFAKQGFDNTTVEEIAAAAEVAPRTFFRYFPRKEDVLFADHAELVARLRDTLATRPADEPVIDTVRRAILAAVERFAADPALFLTRSRLVASVPAANARNLYLETDYEDVIAEAVADGTNSDPATDLQARVISKAIWCANRAAREIWVASGAKRDPRQLVNEAFDLLEHGLRPNERPLRKSRNSRKR
jgi:AcrR family transcriptional regulator